jgi:uncharacterized protein (TIGR01244 family)
MKNTCRLAALPFLILCVHAVMRAQIPQAAQEADKPAITNFVELSARIGTGGQPTAEGLKLLAEKGYKAVVNIRTSSEQVDLAAEEKQAMQLGLRYFMVPFMPKEPNEEQAMAFNALMAALKDTKVFVHCGSGNRVGSLMMIYFALEEGMTVEKAEQEARKIGLRGADLLDFAKQVIGRRKK